MFWRDRLERTKFINSGIVNQDVDLFISSRCLFEELRNILWFRNIALDSNRLASLALDLLDDCVRPSFAAAIVHHY